VNIPEMMPPSAIDALRVISDHKSLVLLSTIALSSGDTSVLLNSLEITKKQYYSRMSALTHNEKERRLFSYFVWQSGL
jgi:type II secretory pathway component PulC